MSHSRIDRVNELLHREVAGSLYRCVQSEEFDHAACTVLRVSTSPDLRNATVYVSIYGKEEAQAHRMVAILVGHRKAIQADVYNKVTFKYSPYLKFERDASVAEGDRVLGILEDLDIPIDPEPEDDDETEEAYDES